jgi:hypothetical protein
VNGQESVADRVRARAPHRLATLRP